MSGQGPQAGGPSPRPAGSEPAASGPAESWHPIGRADLLRAREVTVVRAGEREIAVFRVGDRLHAVDDSCPHAGGPLSDGILEADGSVECPWHGWSFDLSTGACRTAPSAPLRRHELRERDGVVELRLVGA